jgi:hypothetical protein
MAFLADQLATGVPASLPLADPGAAAQQDMPRNSRLCSNRKIKPAALPDETMCVLGGSAPPRVAIWGDSHALAFQPFATAIANRLGMTAITYSRDSCAPAVGHDDDLPALTIARCGEFNALALGRAETMDTVILAARWPGTPSPDFATTLTATVDTLSAHVGRVLVIGATPDLPASVPDCLRKASLHACEVSRTAFLAKSAAIRQLLSSLPARHRNVVYIEPLDFFCDETVCPGVRNGMPLYWDDNHISSTAAAAFARRFLANEAGSGI